SLAGRWALRIPLSLCMGLGLAGMALGMIITLIPNLWMILLGLLVNSFGFFMAHSTASAWVSRHAAFAKASASSLYLLFYYIGGSLGSFYLGVFYHWKGWPALVGGALLVLLGTGWLVRRLYRLEKKENQKSVHPEPMASNL
ncbi:MAG TPA: MFS transporter, partial [Paenibacillaceae bacterium]|nr:MFS transporter [Paenibacillaceae bacterium]